MKLIIFDWDGTLMDSVAKIVTCYHRTFDAFGIPRAADQAIKNTIGLPLDQGMLRLCPELSPVDLEAMALNYRDHWLFGGLHARLFEGIPEMLETLAQEGYLLAIATGKSKKGLVREMGELKLNHLFRAARSSDETSPKPDPHMLHEILQECECDPQQAVMIGDTDFDIHMAHSAGIQSVAVLTGGHTAAQLHASKPTVCLETATQLPQWLRQR